MAELEIDPAQLGAYKALLAEEISSSIALEPGVLALNAVSLRTSPHHLRILEVYASQSAYEAHLATPHFLKYKSATAGMVLSLTLLEVDAISLSAKPTPGSVQPDPGIGG